MATVPTKKTCAKYVKGTGIVTCDGCHQSFCHKHLSEHREELFEQMDKINDQCQRFRKTLSHKNDPSPILSAIDLWEEESIQKIHSTAERARVNAREMARRTVHDFDKAVDRITMNMEFSRESNDTTEIDLTNWTDQLQALRDLLKQPFPVRLMSNETGTSLIHSIKVKYESPFNNFTHKKTKPKRQLTIKHKPHSSDSQQININTEEKFSRVAGRVTLSNNGLIATSVGYSSVCGTQRYGTGIHSIRFQIIAKKNEGIFFGIFASKHDITARAAELPSVYGWRDFNRAITNGNAQLKAHTENNIEPGDQLTLTVDCNHAKLSLIHHQLNQKVQLPVDVSKCPLPWKLLVSSYGEDTIAILH